MHKSLYMYIDGAARGNPGPAGIGVVLRNSEHVLVENIDKFIGNATNNVAEYTALITGMEHAHRLGSKEITINTDSELLAKQLGKEYRVKNPVLKELYSKVLKLLENFEHVVINNIPREKNKDADKLANKAIDDYAKSHAKTGKSFILKSKQIKP
jgi:ribonuclease HI